MLLGSWVLFVDVLPEGGDLVVPWIVIARTEARMHAHTHIHACTCVDVDTHAHVHARILRQCCYAVATLVSIVAMCFKVRVFIDQVRARRANLGVLGDEESDRIDCLLL